MQTLPQLKARYIAAQNEYESITGPLRSEADLEYLVELSVRLGWLTKRIRDVEPTFFERPKKMNEKSGTEKRAYSAAKEIAILFVLALLVFMAGLMSGCNTLSGVGKDLTAASDGIAKSLQE